MLSAILAALLVVVSIALLLFVVSLLFNALHFPIGKMIEQRRFARRQERGRRGDAFLERGDVDRALQEFRSAFFFAPIVSDRNLLSRVHNHHTGLLSRFIAVTEDLQGGTVRLMSLAKVDRLLNERSDLQRRYFNLRDRRNRDGQLRDVYRKLAENRRELEACLRQLVAEIRASRPVARYH